MVNKYRGMKMKYGVLIVMGVLTSWIFTACSSGSIDAAANQDTVEKVPPHLLIEAVPASPKFPDAKIAIATGGLFGKGPGQSVERNFLPEAYADFIYAIIIEEYGLFLGIFMLFLYLWFMYKTINIIKKAPKAFGALIAVGLSFQLVLQALINMAVAVGLFPVTGLTLPLVSKGGTSLIFTFITLGLIMSVSRYIQADSMEEANSNVDSKNNNFITT